MERFGSMQHPDEHVTASYLDGALPAAERERFEAHLSDCGTCRQGLTLLSGVVGAVDGARDEPVPAELLTEARAQAVPAGQRTNVLAAAAVILMVGLSAAAWWARLEPSVDPVLYRDLNDATPLNPRPAAGAVVSADDLQFHWDPVEGADRYVITVLHDDDLLTTITVPAGTDSARWPLDQAAPPPGTHLWQVTALTVDRVIAQSRSIPFEVR